MNKKALDQFANFNEQRDRLLDRQGELDAAEASIKELIAAIPTRRDALYESAVDWEAAEAAGVLESKIRPWLAKKIAEYLGEEEPTLVEFVMTKLAERLPPAKIEAEMVQVLDDDAEMFVVKLWRLLLFEVLRAGAES